MCVCACVCALACVCMKIEHIKAIKTSVHFLAISGEPELMDPAGC